MTATVRPENSDVTACPRPTARHRLRIARCGQPRADLEGALSTHRPRPRRSPRAFRNTTRSGTSSHPPQRDPAGRVAAASRARAVSRSPTTSSTRPAVTASTAERAVRPRAIRLAQPRPTRLTRTGKTIAGIKPSTVSGRPKVDRAVASTTSAAAARPTPPPRAGPSTSATTGRGVVSMARRRAAKVRGSASVDVAGSSDPPSQKTPGMPSRTRTSPASSATAP